VLPAYLIGLVVAGVFLHDQIIVDRLRTIAFALLTPFFSSELACLSPSQPCSPDLAPLPSC
jgi:hypothetical protein